MSFSLGDRFRSTFMLALAGLALSAAASLVLRLATDASWASAFWLFLLLAVVTLLLVLRKARRQLTEDTATLHELATAARESSRGNFERNIDTTRIHTSDLRALAEAMNAAADRARQDIAEMDRLGRVRSEFLGNVSHELRTPIFAVQGYLETLLDGAINDPAVRDDFVRKAHHNVLRLNHLLSDLIEISRIESGEMKMSFRYFDAIEFFGALVEELRPTAEFAGVSLELRISGRKGSGKAFGDRERLKQAAVNLIENAIKYNRPDGLVIVELAFLDDSLEVRVSDTGIGIGAEHLPRIFERFYRVDRDRSRAVGGSGLGLAIVKHILEAHRASISVASVPGEGSTFAFRLKR